MLPAKVLATTKSFKRNWPKYILVILFFGQSIFALPAFRPANIDFRDYIKSSNILEKKEEESNFQRVLEVAEPVSAFKTEQIFSSKISENQITEIFNYVRDLRGINDDSNFERRITWLYPDDGCYVRSALMHFFIREKIKESWSQIFLFGNLELKTNFSPTGLVTWWYHVAPVMRTDKDIFVFDPSVDVNQPLRLAEWLSKINAGPDARVAICDTDSYTPKSYCYHKELDPHEEAISELKNTYFDDEWNRIKELGLNPTEVLGEKPPWRKYEFHFN